MGTRRAVFLTLGCLLVFWAGLEERPVEAQTNMEFFFGSGKGAARVVTVRKVLAVDTVLLDNGQIVRLIGLRAMPSPKPPKKIERDEFGFPVKKEEPPVEDLAWQAMEFVRTLLEGQDIRLELGEQSTDEHYHTLAYVFLTSSDMFVNAEILRQGFAYLRIQPPNLKYARQLREAYQEARREKRGVQNE